MKLNEDLFEPVNGISTLLIDALNKKWDSISNFNSIAVNLKESGYDDMIDVIDGIINDENNHVGQLQKLIEILNPASAEIEVGRGEAEETLEDSDLVDLSESWLRESASFKDDIYSWLENHYATTDWVSSFNAYIDKIKKSGYNTTNLTTDINLAVKKFAKSISVKPQKILSKLQESLRNVDNINRNKNLIHKDAAVESLQEDIDENASVYYVSYYEEQPLLVDENTDNEHYTSTCKLINSEEFHNIDDARNRIAELAAEDGIVEKISDEFYLERSRFVGNDRFYIIETEQGSEEKDGE